MGATQIQADVTAQMATEDGPINNANRMPVTTVTGRVTPLGRFQVTSSAAATSLDDLLADGDGVDAIPSGATFVEFTPDADVRVSDDADNPPSATFGEVVLGGAKVRYRGEDLSKLTFYGASVIDGAFGREA